MEIIRTFLEKRKEKNSQMTPSMNKPKEQHIVIVEMTARPCLWLLFTTAKLQCLPTDE